MTYVKVCGITSVDDAEIAVEAGADAIGLNFVAGTPRCLSTEGAREVSRSIAGRAVRVGVFRDPSPEEVVRTVEDVGLDVVQLHGEEPPELLAALHYPVLKALPGDAHVAAAARRYPGCDLLVDNPSGGGTGQTWPFERVRDLVAGGRRVWIAGGLSPENVASAVHAARPYGVDASSLLERSPGKKDPKKVRAFVRAVRSAAGDPTSPDRRGYFGRFGGRYVPETLMPALDELTEAYAVLCEDAEFARELADARGTYCGRPTPLYFAERLSEDLGPRIYLKREDLAHTGAHKINNAIGQVLIARRMGKTRVIAETGAGQHGVATATACARYGLPCEVYMGEEDMERQALNVFRMELLGARVIPVSSGSRTLKDALNEALRDWATNIGNTYYVIGSTAGPHPYPMLVRDLQSVIGIEARAQILQAERRLPDLLLACVGGGSNALGLFHAFRDDDGVRMVGVEAGGEGVEIGPHGASLSAGSPGVLHGSFSYTLQDDAGQIFPAHSISAGLDYPGVGPEHSLYKESGRVKYVPATDAEALDAFVYLTRIEGILPAFESAHAVAELRKRAATLERDRVVILNLSGRGDKDVMQARELLKDRQ